VSPPRPQNLQALNQLELTLRLGPINPERIALLQEPFSTSAQRQTFHLCICYYYQDLHYWQFHKWFTLILFQHCQHICLHEKGYKTLHIPPSVMNQFFTIPALAPSIFRANVFGQWVVTHSLDDSDFHGHVLAVTTHQHLLWNLKWADIYLTFYHDVRFIPHRLSCLPWQAHYERILHSMNEFNISNSFNLTHLKFENRSQLFQPRTR